MKQMPPKGLNKKELLLKKKPETLAGRNYWISMRTECWTGRYS
jgi:hypothetical protein